VNPTHPPACRVCGAAAVLELRDISRPGNREPVWLAYCATHLPLDHPALSQLAPREA